MKSSDFALFFSFLKSCKAHSAAARQPVYKGICLIDTSVNDEFILYGIAKIGLIFSTLHQLKPVSIPFLTTFKGRNKQIVRAICGNHVHIHFILMLVIVKNFITILRLIMPLRNISDVLPLTIKGITVGSYIYDQTYVPGSIKITPRQRIRVLFSLAIFLADEYAISKSNVRLVLIGDPAHRGFLFELCRAKNIPCIHAINVPQMMMRKYKTSDDFTAHYRQVGDAELSLLPKDGNIASAAERYFLERFGGTVINHDTKRAYNSSNARTTRIKLNAEYNLSPSKKLAVIMSHCFSDAPHSNPGMLYENYEQWLIRTIHAISKNNQIEFLVKEHPSASLYMEEGMTRRMMDNIGFGNRLLKPGINTKDIIFSTDYIITCGGTIGIEAPAHGKPVVLASRPPYSRNGFTIEHTTADEYELFLRDKLHTLDPLRDDQIMKAKKVALILLDLLQNRSPEIELGGVQYSMGEAYDKTAFYLRVIEENAVPLHKQNIYNLLRNFDSSTISPLFNHQKLSVMILNNPAHEINYHATT